MNHIAATPISIDRVYVRIESLLIKEGQAKAKTAGVDGLLNQYNVVKNTKLLF